MYQTKQNKTKWKEKNGKNKSQRQDMKFLPKNVATTFVCNFCYYCHTTHTHTLIWFFMVKAISTNKIMCIEE